MTTDSTSTTSFWGKIGIFSLKYIFVLALLTCFMLVVDPNYFQAGVAEGFLGLEPAKAPSGAFATELTFNAAAGENFKIDLGAKQAELRDVKVEVLDPGGNKVAETTAQLRRPPNLQAKPEWYTFYAPATQNGLYTIRLNQSAPGQVKVYVFQGPHVLRLIFLPIFALIFVFVIEMMRPPSKEALEAKEMEEFLKLK